MIITLKNTSVYVQNCREWLHSNNIIWKYISFLWISYAWAKLRECEWAKCFRNTQLWRNVTNTRLVLGSVHTKLPVTVKPHTHETHFIRNFHKSSVTQFSVIICHLTCNCIMLLHQWPTEVTRSLRIRAFYIT